MKFKKKNTDFEEDEIVVKKTKKSKKNEPVEEKNPFQKRKNSNESLNPLMNSFKAGNNNNETFVKKTIVPSMEDEKKVLEKKNEAIPSDLNEKPIEKVISDEVRLFTERDDVVEEVKDEVVKELPKDSKKDIKTFFDKDSEDSKKLKKNSNNKAEKKEKVKKLSNKDKKRIKQEELIAQKEDKKKGNKKYRKKEKDLTSVKEMNLYRIEKWKYTKVEDFIKHLNENYRDIDEIALSVLKDEKFHGWVSKRSGRFKDAFKEFMEIKEKIEKL